MMILGFHIGSYWWEVKGQAIVGQLTGETLTLAPNTTITWGKCCSNRDARATLPTLPGSGISSPGYAPRPPAVGRNENWG